MKLTEEKLRQHFELWLRLRFTKWQREGIEEWLWEAYEAGYVERGLKPGTWPPKGK